MSQIANVVNVAQDSVKNAARQSVPAVRVMARVGYASRGVIYVLIGALSGMAAVGAAGGRVTDSSGALQNVVAHPFGRVLLGCITLGFFGFAIWQIVLGVEDSARDGSAWRQVMRRVSAFFTALVYLALMLSAIRILVGYQVHGSDHTARDWTAWAMTFPMGRWAVAVVGLGIVIAGVFNLYASATSRIGDRLDAQRLRGASLQAAVMIGRIGVASRGVVFCLIGGYLIIAAWHSDPREARGLAGAMRLLERQRFGPWLLALVALGFVAYGVYEFIQARYRRVEAEGPVVG
jgi:hypothetical protein